MPVSAYDGSIKGYAATKLAPGAYQLRLVAWPVDDGKPTRAHATFRIQGAGG